MRPYDFTVGHLSRWLLAAIFVAPLPGLYLWGEIERLGWERRILPPELAVSRAITSEPGFFRASIFGGGGMCAYLQLTPEVAREIRRDGLVRLNRSRRAFGGLELSSWSETPFPEGSFLKVDGDSAWSARLKCGTIFAKTIDAASNSKGNFYASVGYEGRSPDMVVLVMPDSGRAAVVGYW